MTAPDLSATPRASQRRALREWRRDALINKNHLPSLRDGSGDGIGDLEGLTQCLDYLAGTLGVTALWVRPSPDSPLHDQGLGITGHTDVEPVFGSIETVDRDALAAYSVETRAVTR